MLKKDNVKLGVILGLIVPILVFIIIYFIRFSYYAFGDFLRTFASEGRLVTFFSAWCLVANIALFTLYINSGRYKTARGVFFVTVGYGLGFLLLKLLM